MATLKCATAFLLTYHYLVQSPGNFQVPSSTIICLGLQVDSQGHHLLSDQVQALLSLRGKKTAKIK